MGYFPNGTAGDFYQEHYCDRCRHHPDDPDVPYCSIYSAHLFYNYAALKVGQEQLKATLDLLIPRDKDGENGECSMFIERHTTPLLDTL